MQLTRLWQMQQFDNTRIGNTHASRWGRRTWWSLWMCRTVKKDIHCSSLSFPQANSLYSTPYILLPSLSRRPESPSHSETSCTRSSWVLPFYQSWSLFSPKDWYCYRISAVPGIDCNSTAFGTSSQSLESGSKTYKNHDLMHLQADILEASHELLHELFCFCLTFVTIFYLCMVRCVCWRTKILLSDRSL